MSKEMIDSVVAILTAIIGVAILSVILSNRSNTVGVINAASGGFAKDLSVAISPVSGGTLGITGGGLPSLDTLSPY